MKSRRWIPSGAAVRKIFAAFGVIILLACADSGDQDEMLSYFQPETSTVNPMLVHYHFSPDFVYEREDVWYRESPPAEIDSTPMYNDNLLSWQKYCDNKVSVFAIDRILGSSDSAMEKWLRPNIVPSSIPDSLQFIKYLASHGNRAALDYLSFALRVDAGDTMEHRGFLERRNGKNRHLDRSMLQVALAGAHEVRDPALRERYAFQSVKLASELEGDSIASSLYASLFPRESDTSTMKYWALARVAGGDLRKGDSARALYEFAQVFDNCDSKKYAAYVSLRIHPIPLSEQALAFGETPRERAAVYAISAIQPDVEALPMLKRMSSDFPKNALLELVMAREINKCESGYFVAPNPWRIEEPMDSLHDKHLRDSTADYFDQLRQFALERTKDARISDKAFWFTALAYIEYVRADYSDAEVHLTAAAEAKTGNPALTEQIAIERTMLAIAEQTHMTRTFEARIIPMVAAIHPFEFRHANIFDACCRAISALYLNKPPTILHSGFGCGAASSASDLPDAPLAKAYLFKLMAARPGLSSALGLSPDQTEDTSSGALLDSTIAYLQFANSSGSSSLDHTIDTLAGRPLSAFYEMRGRRAINDFDYQTAVSNFALIPDSVWREDPYKTYLAANPFWMGILEIHAPTSADTVRYTPTSFANRMIALEEEAHSSDPVVAAEANYELGVGTFNLTPEGNSWLIASRAWSPAYVGWGYGDSFDLSDSSATLRAYTYFKHAASLEPNREKAARDVWCAARCEVERYYDYLNRRWAAERVAPSYDREKDESVKDSLFRLEDRRINRTNFAILKAGYSDTKFAQEVIAECSYYRYFVEGGQ